MYLSVTYLTPLLTDHHDMLEPIPPTNPHTLSPRFNSQDYDKLRQRWSLQDDADLDDGEEIEVSEDEYDSDITPVRLPSVAGVLHPSDSSRAYVFCDIRYMTIKMIPGIMGDTSGTARSSRVIVFDWPSLVTTSFAGWIDAVLPIPNNSNKLMYFFSDEDYALINADPGSWLLIDFVPLTIFLPKGTLNDAVIDGPKNIFAQWPSLKSAGFKTIDAVLPNPLNSEQAYFFRGDQYALIHIQQGEFLLYALSRNLVELTSLFRAKQRLHRRWPETNVAMLEGRRVQGNHYDAAKSKSAELKRGLRILKERMCINQYQTR